MRPALPPVIDRGKCIGCKRCVAVCPSFVLAMSEEKAEVVRGDWCIDCGHCEAVCPAAAVSHEGREMDSFPGRERISATSSGELEILFRERRSVRLYTRAPVPGDVLNKILEAGRYAPTGSNSQNVRYIVLRSAEQLSALRGMTARFYEKIFARVSGRFGMLLLSLVAGRKTAEYLRGFLPKIPYARKEIQEGKDRLFFHAPVVVIAHAESWDTSSPFNCSVALYHCSLMAHTLGLGSCFNGFLVNAVNHDSKIRRWLGIPEDHRCYSAMTLGFPDVAYLRPVHRDPPLVTWR